MNEEQDRQWRFTPSRLAEAFAPKIALYLALVCLIFTAPNIDWRGLHQGLECDFALQASPAVEVMGDGPPGILDASMDYASALRCYNYY